MKKSNRNSTKLIVERFRNRRLADDQPELCYTGSIIRNICRQLILNIYHTENAPLAYISTDTVIFCATIADVIQGHDVGLS